LPYYSSPNTIPVASWRFQVDREVELKGGEVVEVHLEGGKVVDLQQLQGLEVV
jgi:hypothetical protein